MAEKRDDQREHEMMLHNRLLTGDPVVTIDLFEHFHVRLFRRLAAKYRTTDEDLVEQAVAETLFDYFQRPERFDPAKKSLNGYLVMSAERDLINLREREERRTGRNRPIDPIEIDSQARKEWEEGDDFTTAFANGEVTAELWESAMAVARTDEERIVQRLRLEGERDTAVYASELGWLDLAPEEQRKRVFEIKDRLQKRSKRRETGHE